MGQTTREKEREIAERELYFEEDMRTECTSSLSISRIQQ
jgi:hypothetical protein